MMPKDVHKKLAESTIMIIGGSKGEAKRTKAPVFTVAP